MTEYLNEGGSNIPVRVGYGHDEQLNLLCVTDPCGRPAEHRRYDIQDRIIAVTNMEGQVMDIAYGVGSFVRRVRRFDGTVMSNAYDAVGRRISTAYLSLDNQEVAEVRQSYYADGKLFKLPVQSPARLYEGPHVAREKDRNRVGGNVILLFA